MIPPGLRLLTYSIPSTSTTDPNPSSSSTTHSLRHGLFRFLSPKQTTVLKYSPEEEELLPALIDDEGNEVESIVEMERLRGMDKELAMYPFEQGEDWMGLVKYVKEKDLREVVGSGGRVDGLMEVEGDEVEIPLAPMTTTARATIASPVKETEAEETSSLKGEIDKEDTLKFVTFDLKRSWRKGAVGEEITRFSRDKSWLLVELLMDHFGGGEC